METGTIGTWNVKDGDAFAPGDIFCSVETDKAVVDFEAQDEGYVAKILQDMGKELKVGQPIMITVEEEDDIAAFADYVVEEVATSSEPAPTTPAEPAPVAPAPTSAPAAAAASTTTHPGDRIFASPKARMLAAAQSKDLGSMIGTGPQGRILAADVEVFDGATAAPTASADTPTASVSVPSLSDKQSRMVVSKQTVPHYYLSMDICLDEILKVRQPDSEIGVYEFMLKAASTAMKTVPTVNAAYYDDFVRVYEKVHIEVNDNLVIEDVQSKGLQDLTADLQKESSNLDVGTFTVLNMGMYGTKSCAPIVRTPQACALGIGSFETRVTKDGENYKESTMCTVTLSCDHRVVDGAVGAQWLAVFKKYVEDPINLLIAG